MRNRKRYDKNFPKRSRAVKEAAGWKCAKCGVEHGTKRVSRWTGNEWPVYLQAAHPDHNPEDPDARLIAVCPSCHWHFYRDPRRGPAWLWEKIKHRLLLAKAFLS